MYIADHYAKAEALLKEADDLAQRIEDLRAVEDVDYSELRYLLELKDGTLMKAQIHATLATVRKAL